MKEIPAVIKNLKDIPLIVRQSMNKMKHKVHEPLTVQDRKFSSEWWYYETKKNGVRPYFL